MPTRNELLAAGYNYFQPAGADFGVVGRGGPELIWVRTTGKLYRIPHSIYEPTTSGALLAALCFIVAELIESLPAGAKKTRLTTLVQSITPDFAEVTI